MHSSGLLQAGSAAAVAAAQRTQPFNQASKPTHPKNINFPQICTAPQAAAAGMLGPHVLTQHPTSNKHTPKA
jgi:hypothetical protein